jgi:hypothetical protein
MKLSQILPLVVVGGAVAGVVVSMSPAQAIMWNWNYTGTGVTASGTFTTTDTPVGGFYTVQDITGVRNGNTITGLVPAGAGNPNVWDRNGLLFSGTGFTFDGISYYVGGTPFGEVSLYSASGNVFDYTSTDTPVSFSATPVPFDTTPGAMLSTIPVLALMYRWKQSRKRIALKTINNSPATVVS